MRWHYLVALAMGVALFGCDNTEQSGSGEADSGAPLSQPRSFERVSANALGDDAYLRQVLPEQTAGYLRIPAPVDFVAGPGGSALAEAKRTRAHMRAVEAIRDAVNEPFAQAHGSAVASLTELLVQRLRSPLEVAFLVREGMPPAAGRTLLSARLAVDGAAEMNEYVTKLADAYPAIRRHQPLTADQDAVLSAGPLQLRLRWRADSQRLMGLAGLGTVAGSDLDERLSGLERVEQHPMHQAESEVDAGRDGLFAWVSGDRLSRWLEANRAVDAPEPLARSGLADARWLALGWGDKAAVAEGGLRKSQLEVVMAAPRQGLRELLPAPSNDFDVDAAGDIDWAVSLALPDAETWRAIDTAIQQRLLPQAPVGKRAYADAKAEVAAALGMSIEDFVSGLGPELIAFGDDAGRFTAARVSATADGTDVLDALRRGGLIDGERDYTHDGTTYHEARIDPPYADSASQDGPANAWVELLQVPYRTYWVRQGEYVVSAATPQALIERDRYHEPTDVGQWLAREQGQDLEHSVLAASVSVDDGPRFVYRQYLKGLSYLAEVVEADIDPFALPTATEAGIPDEGAFGLQIDNAPERFSVELTFEHSPADVGLHSPYAMTAMAGVVAAVAIPAYQDYTERARSTLRDSAGSDRATGAPR